MQSQLLGAFPSSVGKPREVAINVPSRAPFNLIYVTNPLKYKVHHKMYRADPLLYEIHYVMFETNHVHLLCWCTGSYGVP